MASTLLSATRVATKTHLPKLVFPSTHRLFAGPARSFSSSSGGSDNSSGNKTFLPGQPFVPAGTGSSSPASGGVNRSGVSSRVKAVIGSSFSASSASDAYLAGLTNRRFFSTIHAGPSGTQTKNGALNSGDKGEGQEACEDDSGGASSGEAKASATSSTKDDAGGGEQTGFTAEQKAALREFRVKWEARFKELQEQNPGFEVPDIDWDACEKDPVKMTENVTKGFLKGTSGMIHKFTDEEPEIDWESWEENPEKGMKSAVKGLSKGICRMILKVADKFADTESEFTAELAEYFDAKELAKMVYWHPFQVKGDFPSYELTLHEDQWCCRVDMPGIGAKDVNVKFKDNTLYIRGEGKGKGDAAARVYSGKFDIPAGEYLTDDYSVTAKDGVIRISVPKVKA
ncbi:hypothetical protein Tsubulata_026974 [Turnera subulata]|uniref:SHSP domain-containing protein n=1 Tax=Turnera subulata TaxID=218843 RepID=A0A9Q0FIW5_9ROSI|nr:hypothetical protein Tsubulata_026974 [Turnera subulata]